MGNDFSKVFYNLIRMPLLILRYFFLGVFKTVKVISNFIYSISKYFAYGFIYLSILMYKLFNKAPTYLIYGIIVISYIIYKIIKYVTYGFYYPVVMLSDKTAVARSKRIAKREELRLARVRKKIAKKSIKERKQEERVIKETYQKEEKRKFKEKQNIKEVNQVKKELVNEHNSNYKLKQFYNYFKNIPENIKQGFNNWYNNLKFVKDKRNRYELEHQELLINFEGDDAVKSVEKIPYEYIVKDSDGKIIKGHYEAFSKVEVHSFLLSENYEVYSIKTSPWIKLKYGKNKQTTTKFKTKDLIFFLTQLSTYIKSGITLIESLRILARQYRKNKYKQIISNVIYELTMGESFSEAMLKQGHAFPKLLINMVKTAEMTGELPETLDDMADYYTEADKTRKQMITAMTYPTIILVLATAVIVFVLIYVVPQFTEIYASMDGSKIPTFTLFVMSISDFLKHNVVKILIVIAIIVIIFRYLYTHIKSFKTIIQWLLMHMPVFGNVIIYNEVTMFTKTFASLLKHNVFITDSMEILTKVTNNEIYKMIILDTISNLAHGDKLSMSFKGHWAFPIPAYEMLVTGEKTGQLPEMMGKVSTYYQELHKNAVTRIKTFIEPILIIFLTVVVGGIVLAIIIPMFSLYQSVQT